MTEAPPEHGLASGPPIRLFLNYRREDTGGHALHLYDDLLKRFGSGSVFMDMRALEPGLDFGESIEVALTECDVVLCLMGPKWLTMADEDGLRRIDDPDDWVRLELEAALERQGLRVIPILVERARMPRRTELPEPLAPLARRHAFDLTNQHWPEDVTTLVAVLEQVIRQKAEHAVVEQEQQPRLAEEEADRDRLEAEAEHARALEEAARKRAAEEQAERERKELEESERRLAEDAQRRAAEEEAERQRAALEQAERERLAAEGAAALAVQEQAAREQAERERLAAEGAAALAVQEQAAREQAERERLAAEGAAALAVQEQAAREQAERERAAQEQLRRETQPLADEPLSAPPVGEAVAKRWAPVLVAAIGTALVWVGVFVPTSYIDLGWPWALEPVGSALGMTVATGLLALGPSARLRSAGAAALLGFGFTAVFSTLQPAIYSAAAPFEELRVSHLIPIAGAILVVVGGALVARRDLRATNARHALRRAFASHRGLLAVALLGSVLVAGSGVLVQVDFSFGRDDNWGFVFALAYLSVAVGSLAGVAALCAQLLPPVYVFLVVAVVIEGALYAIGDFGIARKVLESGGDYVLLAAVLLGLTLILIAARRASVVARHDADS